MTRKDYILIADTLVRIRPLMDLGSSIVGDGAWEVWNDACEAIASALASDNPRFDRKRFLRACGIPEEEL